MRLLLAFFVGVSALPATTFDLQTPIGNVEIELTSVKVRTIGPMSSGATVEGSVLNNTKSTIRLLRFELVALDQARTDVRMCDSANTGARCEISVFDSIPPGSSVPLKEPGNVIFNDRRLETNRTISSMSMRFIDGDFSPTYSISQAQTQGVLSMTAAVDPQQGIGLIIENTSNEPHWIDWASTSFTGIGGISGSVLPDGVPFAEKSKPISPTIIPPHSKVARSLYPSDLIIFSNDEWVKTPLLPANLKMSAPLPDLSSLRGKMLSLFVTTHGEDGKQQFFQLPFSIQRVEY